MYRKVAVVMFMFLLALPCASQAGIWSKAKSKAKSAGSSVKNAAGDAASFTGSAVKETGIMMVNAPGGAVGEVVDGGGWVVGKSNSLAGQGAQVVGGGVSHVSKPVGVAISVGGSGQEKVGNAITQGSHKVGNKLKGLGIH